MTKKPAMIFCIRHPKELRTNMAETTTAAFGLDSPWWRIREAAQYARCGPKVIYNAVRAGRLRAVRLGGRRELRIRRDWVDAWLERSEVTGEEAV